MDRFQRRPEYDKLLRIIDTSQGFEFEILLRASLRKVPEVSDRNFQMRFTLAQDVQK